MDEKIYWVNTRDVRNMGGEDPRDSVFYRTLDVKPKYNKDYENTEYFKLYELRLEEGENPRRINGITSKEDILERIKFIFNLNKKIKKDGILSEYAVPVMIDEFGKIYALDGNHRLTCAYKNNVEKIPVKIVSRHEKWTNFVDEIKSEYKELKIYNPIYHLDFENVPIARNSEERFNRISNAISELIGVEEVDCLIKGYRTSFQFNNVKYFENDNITRVKGLDLGCHYGFFCHKFAELGAIMTGIEGNEKYIARASVLNKTYGLHVDFYKDDIRNFNKNENYDFTLLLSVAYFLKEKEYQSYIKLLKNISERSKLLFIDERIPEMTKENIVEDVLKNTQYTKYKSLGNCEDNDKREMFVFFK